MPTATSPAPRSKASAALQLRLQGYDWGEIAETIGYADGKAAARATEGALVKQLGASEESRQQMRQMAGIRLDRLLQAVWQRATDTEDPEQLNYVAQARQLIAQHAKLYGLDAPQEYVVHSPTTTELEQWVATVVSQTDDTPSEPDILELTPPDEAPAHDDPDGGQ